MKIGILTFHRAINYGAVLQTYALQETLKKLGHDVFVIDYRQPRVERTDRKPVDPNARNNLLKKMHIRSWWNYNKNLEIVRMRRHHFDQFLNKFIRLTEPCTKDDIPAMDVYVIGSDQVWNSVICDGLDSVFWGDFNRPEKSIVVSYAASTSVNDLKKYNPEIIQNLLMKFKSISVREQQTCDYLNQTLNLINPVRTVLDPTILAEKNIWDIFTSNNHAQENYILFFSARNCKEYPLVLQDKAQSLASQYGCKTEFIDFNADSPVDFINKFRYARAVVTSSFHGVAFSLIFNRPLYAVLYGDEQDARYANVLKTVGAENMLVNLHKDVTPQEFDYSAINSNISLLRISSIEYLKKI